MHTVDTLGFLANVVGIDGLVLLIGGLLFMGVLTLAVGLVILVLLLQKSHPKRAGSGS